MIMKTYLILSITPVSIKVGGFTPTATQKQCCNSPDSSWSCCPRTPFHHYRESCSIVRSRHTTVLSMKRKTVTPTLSTNANINTRLKYKNLVLEEEETTSTKGGWVDKWFEDNLNPWNKHASYKGSKKRGNNRTTVEIDEEMKGSIITHISSPKINICDDLEMLPYKSPMIYNLDITSEIETETRNIKRDDQEGSHSPHQISNFAGDHIERVSNDLSQVAISLASTIDTPQQWIEFSKEVGGLKPILQCIHNVAEEIQGNTIENEIDPLLSTGDGVDRFSTARSACRVLRDLCAKDKYWASAITDEIIRMNRNGTILADLGLLLSHTKEAERIYTRKSWHKRRELRKQGIYSKHVVKTRKQRRESIRKCRLYINQLLLGMAIASDAAVDAFRETPELLETVRGFSSYTREETIRRKWIKYPLEVGRRIISTFQGKGEEPSQSAFLAAASMKTGILGEIQATSNKLLAAVGHNVFVPKTPGQRGLRILSLDGGGTRGIASIAIMKSIVDELGGIEMCDSFDMIVGTSTGAIIAFLVGLRRESNNLAKKRYDELIEKIFVKGFFNSGPMGLLLTTAMYSEVPFEKIMVDILGDNTMIDSRADPRVPLVFCVSSKMSSTTSKLALFRNYNYESGEKEDTFVVSPEVARRKLGFPPNESSSKNESYSPRSTRASRHEGSWRVMQRAALRATTAAPTVFKPVLMGTEMYSDGGLVASNPSAVAIHEARTLFPDIPIEMVVSVGTGEFVSERVSPTFGWDGIISQIVKSATDTSKIHHILQDVLGQGTTANPNSHTSGTKYYRFDPIIGKPSDFPIDGTNPASLERLFKISSDYMKEPEQKKRLREMSRILKGANNFPLLHRRPSSDEL